VRNSPLGQFDNHSKSARQQTRDFTKQRIVLAQCARAHVRAVLGINQAPCTCCYAIGFSIVKMGEQTPPKPHLPLVRRGPPANTAMPQPTPRTSPNHSCTFAQLRRLVLIGYNEALHICLQKYPFPLTDPKTPVAASSLGPSDLPSQTASGSNQPFRHNALDRHTDRQIAGGKL